jgi:D-tagatose-1,6-bisphosphate aldolase subunit GatZ/KbaZ
MSKSLADARDLASILSRGIVSVCSAHPWVIEAAMRAESTSSQHVLIEATCNQVNQDGGYIGKTPAQFRADVEAIASKVEFPLERLILGGDHLGPNPWTGLPAEDAMRKAEEMVRQFVAAGFRKIHLDASMACAGESSPLADDVIAVRAARLCKAAESAAGEEKPVYVVGTEVPTPGGAHEELNSVAVTTTVSASAAVESHRRAFAAHGLSDVWPRVIALVVQPGVEFGNDSVVVYEAGKAKHLQEVLRENPGMVFEAHSTDYQPARVYPELLRDGFRILKVGPALTFAMREALFALDRIEAELPGRQPKASLRAVLDEAMQSQPKDWKNHYHGSAEEQRLMRQFSLSDRARYYWHTPAVAQAVGLLLSNLESVTIPLSLLAEYLPIHFHSIEPNQLATMKPTELVMWAIRRALRPYCHAVR